eukprot:6818762-Prymnesium_polylepis.1
MVSRAAIVLSLLLASCNGLQLERKLPIKLGGAARASAAAAALGTAVSIPLVASASEGAAEGWALPTMPSLPAPPAWLDSKEFHELAIFFVRRLSVKPVNVETGELMPPLNQRKHEAVDRSLTSSARSRTAGANGDLLGRAGGCHRG